MRVAAIDVGTNSTRLLAAEETADGFRPLARRTTITRLGEDVDRRRVLGADALARTLATVADYAAICGELEVRRIRVTGTSAVRDARNQDEFMKGVERLTGELPDLLSGEDEARTAYLGAVSDLQGDSFLLMDVGGGSTELVVGGDEPTRLVSLDVGAVRMFEKHLRADPPTDEERLAVKTEVNEHLRRVSEELHVPRGATLIGVAGTVTQLAALHSGLPVYDPDVVHHMVLSHGDVRRLVRRLASLSLEQRKRLKGMEPRRADVIVAGGDIVLAVMEAFDAAELMVSEKDLLDGLVLQMLR